MNEAQDNVLDFWGVIAPVEEEVIWNGTRKKVLFHILDTDEEEDLVSRVQEEQPERRLIAEGRLRMAYAVLSVDGKPVDMPFDEKVAWIRRWPGTLLDATLIAYGVASRRPLRLLDEFLSDDSFDHALLDIGLASGSAASGTEGS